MLGIQLPYQKQTLLTHLPLSYHSIPFLEFTQLLQLLQLIDKLIWIYILRGLAPIASELTGFMKRLLIHHQKYQDNDIRKNQF